ncbi:MAG TPA: phosphatidate cytidylyltransferase [Peptococcaceae bacterium]|nr:phosphatidate cytidylyltransferase [Peptococcaceae bacterium]
MSKRIVSALIGAPLLLFVTWLGGFYLALLVVMLALLGLREFLLLGQKANLLNSSKYTVGLFSLVWLTVFLTGQTGWLLPLALTWFIVIFGQYALSYPRMGFTEAAFSFLAFIYPVALFTYLYHLRELPQGLIWCFFTFFLVWLTDTGAFFIGNALGRRKLAPKVSPNKSVEGAVGGVIAALLFSFVFWVITKEGSLPVVLLLALVTSLVAQIGDLFESALKRMAGVKDSGNLIPGHGGILDRFDSFLFALPLVYFALVLGLIG